MPADSAIAGMLEDALRSCQAGDFGQAEGLCRGILARNSGIADAWNMLAGVLFTTGRVDESWDCSLQSTRLRPHVAPYWLMRGNIALARHHYPESQASFRRAVELDPAFAEAHYRLALVYHRQDSMAEAIASYRTALRYAPDVGEIYFKLAEALLQLDRWEDALRAYEAAFARDPKNELPRGNCLNLIDRLQWEALPDFWQDEITRYFARDDVDKNRNVSVGLRALSARAAFRPLLAAAAAELDPDALAAAMHDGLFLQLLRDTLVTGPEYEALLTRLRAQCLFNAELRELAPLEFLAALAIQCFNNEYIYADTEAEREKAAALVSRVGVEIRAGLLVAPQTQRMMAVVAMYRPLYEMDFAEIVPGMEALAPALSPLWRRSVLNPAAERRLRESIVADASIADGVSRAVRDMYEEHPYPRWFSIDRTDPLPLSEWIDREAPSAAARAKLPAGSKVLVAGCGTGHEASELAAGLSDARVLAVDLSRTSLAYAQRMAGELGLTNIGFRHGDILGLDALQDRFEMIYCNGVLHHLRDPEAGLRVLVRLLRPGGLLRLSLYSQRARTAVTLARAMVRERNISADASSIREFRQFILAQPADSPLKPLTGTLDFYSMSMCRDLMFHVQEHQMRLPRIKAMLEENGLELLCFTNLPPSAAGAYRRSYPGDPQMTDLSNWDAFESAHPDIFREMYQFWCTKA